MCERGENGEIVICEEHSEDDVIFEGLDKSMPWYGFDKDGKLVPCGPGDLPTYLIKNKTGSAACPAEICGKCGKIECTNARCTEHRRCEKPSKTAP